MPATEAVRGSGSEGKSSTLITIVTAHIIKALLTFMAHMPMKVRQAFAWLTAVTLQHLLKYRKGVITENISKAYPKLEKREKELMIRRYYQHMAGMIWETIGLLRSRSPKHTPPILVENPEVLRAQAAKGRDVVIMAGHQGNWEYFNQALNYCGFRALAVYKPQSGRLSDLIMQMIRKNDDVVLTTMKETLRNFIRVTADEKPTALLLVADQTPAKGDIRMWIPFLNQNTAWFNGGEKIARKFGLPVYYLNVTKTGFNRYLTKVLTIAENPDTLKDGQIMASYVQLLEQNIHEQPEIWLWSHRRWKHKPA